MRLVLTVVAACVIAAPLAILVTVLTMPFWSWIEHTFGVESVGHSGPAEWCFAVTYVVLVVPLSVLLVRVARAAK